jgi:hypothetical protein
MSEHKQLEKAIVTPQSSSNSKFGLEAKEKAVTRRTEVAREDDIQLRKSREGQAVARCSVNGD